MKKMMKIFALMSLSLVAFSTYGQYLEEEKGDNHLEVFEFEKAIKDYKKAYDKDESNPVVTRKIADAYRRKGDLASSADWYKKTLDLDDTRKEDMLYYAEALKTIKNYDESLKWYEKYNSVQPEDERAENHLENDTYYEELTEDSVLFVVKSLDFNNRKPAFGVTKYEEKLVFSAAGIDGHDSNSKNPWNDLPYLDVYEGNIDEQHQIVDIEPINPVNSKYNDGPAHYCKALDIMFVTRNNMKRGKPVKDKTGSVNLKIYASKRENGEWGEMYELPFNSDEYSTGHPAITNDGRIMYFASNRPGGYGGTDIYFTERVNDTWSIPQNLGETVNTKGDEMFPYVDENNVLYFSSTGHVGLGGLDIFKMNLDSIQTKNPKNIGYPLNSSKDDFSILFEETDRSGYFCSNRDRGFSDNVYYFEINNLLQKIYAGRIESSLPDKSLAGEELTIRNLETREEIKVTLDDTGEFEFLAEPGNTYELAYQKEDVEEILVTKTVEDVIAEEYENLGIFTIEERLIVNVYDEGENIEINDVLYKRFSEDNRFISEEGDTLSNIEMMDMLSRNLEGNDITFNNEEYLVNPDEEGYKRENGEAMDEEELELLLVGEIFADPLDISDDSFLAGMDSKLDFLNESDKLELSSAEMIDLTALEWVNLKLKDESLSEDQRLELEALKLTDLDNISAADWTEYYNQNPEEAFDLTTVERKALGLSNNLDNLENLENRDLNLNEEFSAYDYVQTALRNDDLSPEMRLELENLKGSDLEDISANEWIEIYKNDPAKADMLTSVERKALGITDHGENLVNVPDYVEDVKPADNVQPEEDVKPLEVSNPEEYAIVSEEDLKVTLTNRNIENIYFDFDKSNIRPDAREILDEVASVLISNPGVNMYVNAHTDARGSNTYNDWLSEERAASVRKYLKNRGVEPNRLSLSWFGEDQLTNECNDSANCAENAHQMNRRAAFALAGEITHESNHTSSSNRNIEKTAARTADMTGINPGKPDAELENTHGFEIIYFDYDKSNIRKDARVILDVIAAAMQANNKSIVINAHTDSRGSNAYNVRLSQQRANSTIKYLMNQGISKDRITINWSGETQLTNSCSNGITCSTDDHQLNRRATLVWK